jgi:streptomycin 6-kinase
MTMAIGDGVQDTAGADPQLRRLRKIVQGALPGAQILRVVPLSPDASASGETAKRGGYGLPVRIDVVHDGKPRSLVLHTAQANAFGHDRRADRAAAAVVSADTFGLIPLHVEVIDVGAYRNGDGAVSLAGTDEFYLLTAHAPGRIYADDLRHIARTGTLAPPDLARSRTLVTYLAQLHARRPPRAKVGYERFVRDTLGSGEGIFGITDSYPDAVPNAPRARLNRIEEACLGWRFRLREKTERLRRTHGDFHPFNVLFNDRSELALLDASRGAVGDPGDDVSCMTINYAFFSLGQPGAWREAFAPLWHSFWASYLAETRDDGVLEVVAPLFAWRGLVLASPTWYPDLAADDRERILAFVERVLTAERFSPAMADEFFDT